MGFFIILMVLVVLPAILSTVIASILGYRSKTMPRARRIAYAALPAGLLPVSPAIVSVLHTYSSPVPVIAVTALGLIVAAVIAAPAAWLATRSKTPPPDPKAFD
ncbi:hypothetical protein [Novosphingobium cyanobacteriorum]|uniref:Uncharacterized protein n=1 Tax=Novosphingobium cyanobacteriorum TaxID=3024215 RepID=A0ABT6CMN7_9SPHN|nr:hypothetical protein [Novosphingobium cyanobacteriorum]MDF8334838.1 hypothetical protein [Novosphingobium cyanobacteriorum]